MPLVWSSTPATRTLPPKKYALLLGNSISFGWQPTANVLHATEVNLACPGETTETFVAGGCFYTELLGFPLHTSYTGPQLGAAEHFLRGHRGQVNPIILSLGANER